MVKRCHRCGGIIPDITFETFVDRICGKDDCKYHIKEQSIFDFKEFFRYI